jgi:hypothetical protein
MNISLVPPDYIFTAWNQVREYMLKALERCNGRWTSEHLCAALAMGNSQLWIAYDDEKVWGAMTTEVTNYPGKKMLAMHFLGGDEFDRWYPQMLEMVTSYAKDCGCDGLEGVARFGFWKWLEKDGFKKSSVFYEKDIENV